jgi:hypothetical protein
MHMRHIMTSSVACAALLFFPTLSNKRHDLKNKKFEHKMCIFIFSKNLLETFLIPSRNARDIFKKCILGFKSSTRYSCQIRMNFEISRQIFE